MKYIINILIIIFLLLTNVHSQDIKKELSELKTLYETGILTKEEYDAAKKIVSEKGYKEKVIKSKKKKKIEENKTQIEIVKKKKENDINQKSRIERNKIWNDKIKTALKNEKNKPFCKVVIKRKKDEKVNYCIKESDVLKLGYYEKLIPPDYILKEMRGCKTGACIRKKAGSKIFEYFVQRDEKYHAKHPGDIIKGMAWFEIFFLDKLKRNKNKIDEYFQKSGQLNLTKQKNIYSLIQTNKGRIKMREALGFTVYDDMYYVMENQWLLGEFLNKDKLKAVKVDIGENMKKKKKLIEKYQVTLAKYKEKLEEQKKINENKF